MTLGGDAFADLMAACAPFGDRPRVAVAVSGGADSLALALLAAEWAKARGGQVLALHVDHGLRPESAIEARQTRSWLQAHGVDCRILSWTEGPHGPASQSRARKARHKLLAQACRSAGLLHLLFAHHRLDQAETVLMRQRHGSGPDGLAGMSAVAEVGGLRQIRPLLGIDPKALRDYLTGLGQPWIDDPSNRNARFERVRVRGELACGPLAVDGLLQIAVAAGRDRQAREQAAARLMAEALQPRREGWVLFDRDALRRAEPSLARHVIGRLVMAIGGAAYPPGPGQLDRLVGRLLADAPPKGATLGGCRFAPSRAGLWLACRETRKGPAALDLAPGQAGRWDGRFDVRLSADAPGPVRVVFFGQAGERLGDPAPLKALPAMVRAGIPAVVDAKGVLALPLIGYTRDAGAPVVRLRAAPAHGLTGTGFALPKAV